jgi:hypothetical protein
MVERRTPLKNAPANRTNLPEMTVVTSAFVFIGGLLCASHQAMEVAGAILAAAALLKLADLAKSAHAVPAHIAGERGPRQRLDRK